MTNSYAGSGKPMTLWCTPHSLYSGKVRSYLIKKGLPFRELLPPHPRFQREVVPTLRHFVVPVLETSDGEFIQDSTIILEELECSFPERPMVPATPVQCVVAHLLSGFGSEGLLSVAMHYRWSYRAEQERFLRAEFGRATHSGPDRNGRLEAGSALMDYFSDFLPGLGVTPNTAAAHEASFEELLEALDLHFQAYPYMLGGHPSIADFGFMAPLFAHLSRDPVPSVLMKNYAPNVFRWTERMNMALITDGEFPEHAPQWFPDDKIPETLLPVIALMFKDWGAQLVADAEYFNAWLQAKPDPKAGHLLSHDGERKVHPVLGEVSYSWRGTTMTRHCMPHNLWHFERGASLARNLKGDAKKQYAALVKCTGGSEVMQIELVRAIERKDDVLVLA